MIGYKVGMRVVSVVTRLSNYLFIIFRNKQGLVSIPHTTNK